MILYLHKIKEGSYKPSDSLSFLKESVINYCNRNNITIGAQAFCAKDFKLSREDKGKPILRTSDLSNEVHFSVSHTKDIWICGINSFPLGIDIESFNRIKEGKSILKIAYRFFHKDEKAYAKIVGEEVFLNIWTRKEAYVKWKGTGLAEGLATFSVVKDGELADVIEKKGVKAFVFDKKIISDEKSWYFACCSACKVQLEEMIWM